MVFPFGFQFFQDPLHLYSDASTIHIYLQDWEMVGETSGLQVGWRLAVVDSLWVFNESLFSSILWVMSGEMLVFVVWDYYFSVASSQVEIEII